jgi:hypothetical protein
MNKVESQSIEFIYQRFNKKIQVLLPFKKKNGAWLRIEKLQQENNGVLKDMSDLSDIYKQLIPEPREIYLTIQEVRSSTVYIRWRKRGINGNQSYLTMDSLEGRDFLLQQTQDVRTLFQNFNHLSLQLNLAYSLRLNEIKRIKKYLDSYLSAVN